MALYIHESINVTTLEKISECSEDIECLFLQSTNTIVPITFGFLYRPNHGNKEKFCDKLENIFECLPSSNVYMMGDYNLNLLGKNASNKYEDTFMASGYNPRISTYTHERPGTKRSCIDNIFTNDIHNIISGTISDKMSHHLPAFQFSDISPESQSGTTF